MRRLLPGLAAFAGVVSMPLTVSHAGSPGTPAANYRSDSRLQSLRNFFQKFSCPVMNYSLEFLEAADAYKLDWRLLPSIAFVESRGGKVAPNNNVFGWDSGRARFASISAAIRQVAYRLTHSPLYRDKDLDALLLTYNPRTEYTGRVKSVMRQIAPNE